ncbi:MAG TPA: bifunctional homocysteine S-methyltransferase/methylenetetrahydrofolate reductase [Methylomirabilota bacterium]|nr:bifunctional homocysteine S-methyltransferase/methylenetetrahydrofolate reductase [Methylomirabilota bacterium]
MKIQDFNERLKDSILIADGAMGSMLHEAVGLVRCFDELNTSEPEAVFRVHQSYIEAGAQIIETNTFSANRHKLAPLGLADQVARLNSAGVKIAREARDAAAREVFVAGSIGPSGGIGLGRSLSDEELRAGFREQAAALEDRGVDLFVLETFGDLDEIVAAIEAIRAFSNLPIIAEMTFSEEGQTLGGTRARAVSERLAKLNVQAIGTNCTLGPQLLLPILEEFSGCGLPLSAMPNAGIPQRVGGRIVYPRSSPEYFAEFAREAAALGARVVGGCCGTTPEHIRAVAEAVRGLQPARAPLRAAARVEVPAMPRKAVTREPESVLWRKIHAGEFVVSVEIDPPKGIQLERTFEQVERILHSGHVDAIDINSGSMARVGMDALQLAGALAARGVETIPHVTTRDQNLIGLQAALLGSWAVGGVRNILAITGDPPSLGDYPESAGVYEIDSVGLVQVLARLNQGTDWAGKTLGGATNFTIGAALNPVADDLEYEIARYHAKVEAGAHFFMTQPIFDPAHWRAFCSRIGGKPAVPVLVGIWPLTSYKLALRLNNEVPGIIIPQPVLEELEAAGAEARQVGFKLAHRMLEWARTELAGAYLIAPFKRYEDVLEVFA